MGSSLYDSYSYILQEDIVHNNFLFFAHKLRHNHAAKLGQQYCLRLEKINRYESENGQGTITDHVKIATVVNNLNGPTAQNLMMRINGATTFDE
eukprot:740727-Amphidinium_carterae.1